MDREIINDLSRQSDYSINDISILVREIKKMIAECNPLEILEYAYIDFIKSSIGKTSEFQLTVDDIFKGREIEYIQSVLVSSENKYIKKRSSDSENNMKNYNLITHKVNELYRVVQMDEFLLNIEKESVSEFDKEDEDFLVNAQAHMFARGDRYQVYEIPHLRELFKVHNDEFERLYEITTSDFVNGLENIQKSLTTVDIEKEFGREYEKFDLQKLTNWPIELLNDLSFSINENQDFFNNEYSGWPIIELPIFKKPFIKIDNKYYCFDYYSLFDNIYRVIQKLFRGKDSTYADLWISRQNNVTENMVANLFRKVLPGCTVYISNYYPKKKSLKQCAENDILVLYDDNLIIAEVKAGSYTYRAPILDIKSHKKSLETLIKKADGQAERTLKYLKSADKVKLYNKDKSEKCEITLNKFNEITLMCVTLDNFNEFCSKIDKLNFLKINKNTIALSIDDLRVYTDYFESPLTFLHYLKQRKLANQNRKLYLNDELDHLGMYIENNNYSRILGNGECNYIMAFGFREELDKYFGMLFYNKTQAVKPKQEFPREFKEIINFLDKCNLKEKSKLARVLLSFPSNIKNEFSGGINRALKREREIKRMVQMSLTGESPVCVFCHQAGIKEMSPKEISDYTKATMINLNDNYRVELNLYYTNYAELKDIKFNFYEVNKIKQGEIKEIEAFGKELAISKIETYKKINNIKKIGRNHLCPCGSGKKYKNCHGK